MNKAILIPARGGSKRIPNKNIVNLLGKPLIHYTILQSLKVTEQVYVSTDCEKIKKVCRKYDVEIIDRPAQISRDNSTSNSVVEHFLNNFDVELFALVQPTSPLIKSEYLNNGFCKFSTLKFDTIISSYEVVEFYWSKKGIPRNFSLGKKKRTQEIESWFVENGAFYITNRDNFFKYNNLIGPRVGISKMPKIDSVDIDTFEDLEIAESVLTYRKVVNENSR